jgi:hypothetical protein
VAKLAWRRHRVIGASRMARHGAGLAAAAKNESVAGAMAKAAKKKITASWRKAYNEAPGKRQRIENENGGGNIGGIGNRKSAAGGELAAESNGGIMWRGGEAANRRGERRGIGIKRRENQ